MLTNEAFLSLTSTTLLPLCFDSWWSRGTFWFTLYCCCWLWFGFVCFFCSDLASSCSFPAPKKSIRRRGKWLWLSIIMAGRIPPGLVCTWWWWWVFWLFYYVQYYTTFTVCLYPYWVLATLASFNGVFSGRPKTWAIWRGSNYLVLVNVNPKCQGDLLDINFNLILPNV